MEIFLKICKETFWPAECPDGPELIGALVREDKLTVLVNKLYYWHGYEAREDLKFFPDLLRVFAGFQGSYGNPQLQSFMVNAATPHSCLRPSAEVCEAARGVLDLWNRTPSPRPLAKSPDFRSALREDLRDLRRAAVAEEDPPISVNVVTPELPRVLERLCGLRIQDTLAILESIKTKTCCVSGHALELQFSGEVTFVVRRGHWRIQMRQITRADRWGLHLTYEQKV